MAGVPVKVSSITVAGNERTQLVFFEAELDDVLSTRSGAHTNVHTRKVLTLQELHGKLSESSQRLLNSNLFETVDIDCTVSAPSDSSPRTAPVRNLHSVDVKIHVKERGVPYLKFSSYVRSPMSGSGGVSGGDGSSSVGGSGDIGVELQGALRNLSGFGDITRVTSITAKSGSRELAASLSLPNFGCSFLPLLDAAYHQLTYPQEEPHTEKQLQNAQKQSPGNRRKAMSKAIDFYPSLRSFLLGATMTLTAKSGTEEAMSGTTATAAATGANPAGANATGDLIENPIKTTPALFAKNAPTSAVAQQHQQHHQQQQQQQQQFASSGGVLPIGFAVAPFPSFKRHVDSLSFELTSRDQRHIFSVEYALRDEIPINLVSLRDSIASSSASASSAEKGVPRQNNAVRSSVAVLSSATSSIKSSLKYLVTAVDSRDSAIMPTNGEYLKGSLELALPPGNAQFVRTEIAAQVHRTLWPPPSPPHYDINNNSSNSSNRGEERDSGGGASSASMTGLVGSICANLGLMVPLSAVTPRLFGGSGRNLGPGGKSGENLARPTSFLSDRYHVGGPMSVRGFQTYGIGPRAQVQVKQSPPAVWSDAANNNSNNNYTNNNSSVGRDGNAVVFGESLGGNAKTSILACLSVPIPLPSSAQFSAGFSATSSSNNDNNSGSDGSFIQGLTYKYTNQCRAFLFVNAGSLGSFNYHNNMSLSYSNHSSPSSSSSPYFGSLRASVGGGLSLSVSDVVRVEATYAIPLIRAKHDQVKSFQFGVGVNIE